MNTKEYTFQAILFQDGDHWIAQGVEYDLAAGGESVSDAVYEFERSIMVHVKACQEHSIEPLKNLPPAPQSVWDKAHNSHVLIPNMKRFSFNDEIPQLVFKLAA